MNRRQFNFSLAAIGFAPAMPMAAPVSQSAPLSAHALAWGQAIAKAQGGANPAMMVRHLGVSAATAEAISARVLANGIVPLGSYLSFGSKASVAPSVTLEPMKKLLTTEDDLEPLPDADQSEERSQPGA